MNNLRLMIATMIFIHSPAFTTPPPLSMPVVVISDDEEAQAVGEAFVTVLFERGWLVRSTISLQRGQFYECFRKNSQLELCIRRLTTWKDDTSAVVIWVSGSRKQKWKCIGTAAKTKYPDKQTVSVLINQGLYGSPEERRFERNKAAGCIIAAGAESDW